MPTFDSNGVAVAYDAIGDGRPIVLVHGFASSRVRNWKETSWYETLVAAGHRVVALDCRGHGESDKPHDPAAYDVAAMTGDVVRLMDHLGIDRADVMGYSMGGRLATALLAHHAERFASAVLGGVGVEMMGERVGVEPIARTLEAKDAARITDPAGRAFRAFAEQGRNDLYALAACMRGLRYVVNAADLARIRVPVLVVAGENDTLVGDPRGVVDLIPGAQLVIVPGRDHLSTVGDRRYKHAVVEFLQQHGVGASSRC